MSTTHAKVSTKTDSADTTLVRPSDWNADHVGNGLDWFNVMDYGATGDGVTDDTAEIQAAMDAAVAVGATVWFPAGTYKVTTLLPTRGAILRGESPSTNTSAVLIGSTILGTTGVPIFILQQSGVAVAYGDFRFSNLRLKGGLDCIQALSYVTFVYLDDVDFISPTRAGVYIEGAAEEWYFRNCKFDFGQYGLYVPRVLNVSGYSLIDKFQFLTTRFDAQTKNNIRLECRNIDGVTFMDCTFQLSGEHGVYVNGGARNMLFIQCTTEGIGQNGKNATTTATMSFGSFTATLASATGFTTGDPITIYGAGTGGYEDLSTVIDNLVGTTATLHDAANAAVTTSPATNASYDEFHFMGDGTYDPGASTFIGCFIAGEGFGAKLRYSIRVYGTCTLIGVTNFAGIIPVYDPGHWVSVIGMDVPIRQPNTYVGQAFRQTKLSGMIGGQAAQDKYNVVPSAPGGNLILGLRSNTDLYGSTFGNMEVRTADVNHTRIFSVNGMTGDVSLGSASTTIKTGSGSPESVVTAPVGSIFLRTDGSTSTTLYVKTSGSGNTGWTAK